MSARKRQPATRSKVKSPSPKRKWLLWLWDWAPYLAMVTLAIFAYYLKKQQQQQDGRSRSVQTFLPRPKGTLTFNKDVASIIFSHCSECHRPGQPAPFGLLSFQDVKKHAREIVDVTSRRFMPPWPPDREYSDLANTRALDAEQLGILQQWFAEGAVEGNLVDLPPLPKFTDGWRLGQPDLVIEMPTPYTLPAEGKDVYRNFVIPIPTPATRFVRGVEFQPGNAKVVHHAFINVDETRNSRRLAAKQNPPSFEGMEMPEGAVMPGGQLLGWQPGKLPAFAPDGLAWALKPGTDLVLQMHMHPTGKPEAVRAAVGFYFTDVAPTNIPFRLKLTRFDFEIPAGASNYVVEQSYMLPVSVTALRILPHVHYLGKDLQAYAELPGGEKRGLLRIQNWDFNWQGDYQFSKPIDFPKGTRLVMRYTYDNSTNNVHNPNQPPRSVRHGLQTTDEMAGLVLQVIAGSPEDRALLARHYYDYFVDVSLDFYRYRIQRDVRDGEAHMRLGRALSSRKQIAEAIDHLQTAIRINPADDKAHYELGYVYLNQNRLPEAEQEFLAVVRVNPADYQAFGNLGLICLTQGRNADAQAHLETALRLNPDDATAHQNLARLRAMK
ncbi:MAG: tetratricopeptide repeat protein [Verrucomicrobia bacterium]|nr:tetratricopeptide repeat protein [Verrucomicrobiota bacterium]